MGVWTSAWASARIAVRALRVNKLRSALTMLGIVIGVGAVITMVAVGAGAQARVAEQIQSLGSNMIIVLSGSIPSGGVRMGSGSQLTITEDDAWAIAARDPGASRSAAPTLRGGAQVVYGNLNWATGIQGVTPEYLRPRASGTWPTGGLFSQEDVDGAAKVALLGHTVAEQSLRRHRPARPGDPRSRTCPSRSSACSTRKGQTTCGQDQDDTVLIPLSTAKKKVLGREPGQCALGGPISVKVRGRRAPCRRPSRRSARCCASATACRPPGRRLHRCATSPRCCSAGGRRRGC